MLKNWKKTVALLLTGAMLGTVIPTQHAFAQQHAGKQAGKPATSGQPTTSQAPSGSQRPAPSVSQRPSPSKSRPQGNQNPKKEVLKAQAGSQMPHTPIHRPQIADQKPQTGGHKPQTGQQNPKKGNPNILPGDQKGLNLVGKGKTGNGDKDMNRGGSNKSKDQAKEFAMGKHKTDATGSNNSGSSAGTSTRGSSHDSKDSKESASDHHKNGSNHKDGDKRKKPGKGPKKQGPKQDPKGSPSTADPKNPSKEKGNDHDHCNATIVIIRGRGLDPDQVSGGDGGYFDSTTGSGYGVSGVDPSIGGFPYDPGISGLSGQQYDAGTMGSLGPQYGAGNPSTGVSDRPVVVSRDSRSSSYDSNESTVDEELPDFSVEGLTAFQAGDYAAAVEAWELAVEQSPRDGVLRMMLAQALLAVGDYDAAAEMTREGMLRLKPQYWGIVVVSLERLYAIDSDTSDYPDHIRALDEAVEDDPTSADLLFLRGFQVGYRGDPGTAVRELEGIPADRFADALKKEMSRKVVP